MTPAAPLFWLIAKPGGDFTDITVPWIQAGYRLHTTDVDLVPPTHSNEHSQTVVGLIVDTAETAVSLTRRIRAEFFNCPLPILWLLNEPSLELATSGLEAGADACLIRPTDPKLLIAQIQSLSSARDRCFHRASRDAELGHLGERLQRAIRQSETEIELLRRLEKLTSANPSASPCHVDAFDHKGPTRGTWLYQSVKFNNNTTGCIIVEVGGLSTIGCYLVGSTILHQLTLSPGTPGQALTELNGRLVEGILPGDAIVSALVFQYDREAGRAHLALAGMPAAAVVRADAPAEMLTESGSFLGLVNSNYTDIEIPLVAGERVVFLAGPGASGVRGTLKPIVDQHRSAHGAVYVELVGRELNAKKTSIDDGLLVVCVQIG